MQKLPLAPDVETKAVLRMAARAHKQLAELKGVLSSIPNESILLETLTLREAQDSSAIENILSTFPEVYQSDSHNNHFANAAAKEIHHYATGLKKGFVAVKKSGLLTNNHILQIQKEIVENEAGFRKLPGTQLINDKTGQVVYTPPQDASDILELMKNLEQFINDSSMMEADPLVKMAIIHHQFESIHPFYEGNGRTGRVINILYLVKENLIHLPVLYLSRYIIQHKGEYYRLLQQVREKAGWEEWIIFMLRGVEQTSQEGIVLISDIKNLMQEVKIVMKENYPKIYSQDLLNHLFKYPYTKIEYIQRELDVSRSTAIRYLEILVDGNILTKEKSGRENFYLNQQLIRILRT